jgi:hypothetical protein
MKQNKNKRLKLCYPPLGWPLKRKMVLKKLNINPPKNLEKEGRIHRP